MEVDWQTVIIAIVGSSVFAAIATNWQETRQHRKEIVAGAVKSAVRRVEMYYRVRRRRQDGEDDVSLRDIFHEIQEENDYYQALLEVESPWLGAAYRDFLKELKSELQPFMTEAWKPKRANKPDAQLLIEKRPEVDAIVRRFSRKGRRFFNPCARVVARIKYSASNFNSKDKE